ncbi:MAG: glycerate kinase, partial [Clostridiales bacterium]|nr:glycerate kinase [Clostridiales bacterium]
NFFGAELKSGADIVMEITGAEKLISEADIVITGEGRMDSQTVNGKAPYKVLLLGKKMDKPVYGITGLLGSGYEECLKEGFVRIVPLIDPSMDTGEAILSVEKTVARLFAELQASSEDKQI